MSILLFGFLALLSEIIGTIGGFGSSVFFVPLASMFYDFKTVLAITGIFHVFSNISKLIIFKKGIDKKLLFTFGIPSVIAVAIGAYFSKYISENKFITELALGIFLILFSSAFLYFKNISVKPTKINAGTLGASAGFLAGFIGTGGVIRGLALTSFHLEKVTFVITSAAIDLGVDLTRTILYVGSGYFSMKYLPLVGVLIVVSYVGSWIGNKIVERIPQEKFRTVVLLLILGIGLFMCYNALKV